MRENSPVSLRHPLAGLLCLMLLCAVAQAQPASNTARVAIIIDDIGYNLQHGQRALSIPQTLTYSFFPIAPHRDRLLQFAEQRGKEIMLHLPMESLHSQHTLGAGAVLSAHNSEKIRQQVHAALAAVPRAVAVNNHQGSLLTSLPEPMQAVMRALREHGTQIYVDSRTTAKTLAEDSARAQGLVALRRDVFLDNVEDASAIRQQLAALINLAKLRGSAVAIGHPKEATLLVLEQELPRLAAAGVQFVSVSELAKSTRAANTTLSAAANPTR